MSTKRKLDVKVAKPAIKQSAKSLEKQRVNDSQAIVTSGGGALTNGKPEVVEISSAEEEESEEEEDSEKSDDEDAAAEDISMKDAASENEEIEPSFGDLVRTNAAEPIDVAGAFDDPSSNAIKKSSNGNQNIQRLGASLGTVLTQALKTNDQSLLEQCLLETNLQTIRLTLQRLASPLVANLLHHLAARLHRRPGRAGSLIVWIQWALVTHGGYLATQQAVCKELEELHRVVDERSRGLQPLLMLKGKLDMLEAQVKLRKSMQSTARNLDDEEDEEAVIYVEGEESDEDENDGNSNGRITNGVADSDAESEVSDDMPNTNGVADSEADSEDEDSDGGLIDDEAEETDAESGDEDEIDFDDQDEMEEEEDSDDEKDAAPPSKMQKVGGSTFSRKK